MGSPTSQIVWLPPTARSGPDRPQPFSDRDVFIDTRADQSDFCPASRRGNDRQYPAGFPISEIYFQVSQII